MNNGIRRHDNPEPASGYAAYRVRVAGTTIDDRTLLSTDYFNSFNEIAMLLMMVADAPEILDDIKAWKFRTYQEHFQESGLAFSGLAIEAYAHAPAEIRQRFEEIIHELRQVIDEARKKLNPATNDDELRRLKLRATDYARHLQELIERGSGIVHGADLGIDQGVVDKMF